ncbi:hypothetical protein HDV02_000617 [Globomyces sp. JEL0801]|nr:hypothetical protein HDV02_000617 [Globomyces sp. JEL0801]
MDLLIFSMTGMNIIDLPHTILEGIANHLELPDYHNLRDSFSNDLPKVPSLTWEAYDSSVSQITKALETSTQILDYSTILTPTIQHLTPTRIRKLFSHHQHPTLLKVLANEQHFTPEIREELFAPFVFT